VQADETEGKLIELVTDSPVHVEEIWRQSQLPIQQFSSTLAMMELRGMVSQVGGMRYDVSHNGEVPHRIC
jgi:predicted Rossmann fold nucleotide-binding protein DprA/Smf involved in DNA uptake